MRAGQDHLQRHDAVEPQLAGLVDDAHAAPAQLLQQLVAGNRGRRAGSGQCGRGGGEALPQVLRQERKPLGVLPGLHVRLAPAAQLALPREQVHQQSGILLQLGVAVQIAFDADRLPRLETVLQVHVYQRFEHFAPVRVLGRRQVVVQLRRPAFGPLPIEALETFVHFGRIRVCRRLRGFGRPRPGRPIGEQGRWFLAGGRAHGSPLAERTESQTQAVERQMHGELLFLSD